MDAVQESSKKVQCLAFPLHAVPGDLGQRVYEARRGRRWSQARLAERAGIARASVYRLEDGRPSSADTIFRIADALDVPIADLVPRWPEWEPVKGIGPGAATREGRRAIGLTIRQLAQIAGVSEATLSRHERGLVCSPRLVFVHGEEQFLRNEPLECALSSKRRD